jgi:hypothetical protein
MEPGKDTGNTRLPYETLFRSQQLKTWLLCGSYMEDVVFIVTDVRTTISKLPSLVLLVSTMKTVESLMLFAVYMRPSSLYRMFRAQADWTLTHTSHKGTEQSTIEASITLDGVTRTNSLLT